MHPPQTYSSTHARTHALVGEKPLTKQVELMRRLSVVHFSSGEVIFWQGDLSDALYFVLGPTTTDPEADSHDDEYILLTTETNEKGDEAGGDGGDESKRELPFIPSQGFFGEEGLVYRSVCANGVRSVFLPTLVQAQRAAVQDLWCSDGACGAFTLSAYIAILAEECVSVPTCVHPMHATLRNKLQ